MQLVCDQGFRHVPLHSSLLCMHMLQSRCILTLHRVLIRDRLHCCATARSVCPCSTLRRSCTDRGAAAGLEHALQVREAATLLAAATADDAIA